MLSRVADALFWMSRYLERAEHVARLLDVSFHLDLDLHGVLGESGRWHWTSVGDILRIPQAQTDPVALSEALTFDLDNPSSIMACVSRARDNARSVRGTINLEMWKELNKLYWQLRDPEFVGRARESPHDFYQAVECGSHLFQGVCDATLIRDEGWQFIQLGKLLERADITLRILDVKYHLLQKLTGPSDLPLSNLHWAGVLRSCRGYEAYQRLYVSRVEPERVVEFILVHEQFPRSVRHSLEASARALAAMDGQEKTRADRILGRVLSDLAYVEMDQLLDGDLHAFLGGVQERCAQVSKAVQDQYTLQ